MIEHAAPVGQNTRVQDQFAKRAESYAALIRNARDPSLPALLQAVQPAPDDRLLDVGCGSGAFAIQMAALVEQVVGVDLSSHMLEQASRAQAQARAPNIEWRQADVVELPYDAGTFSIVTSRAMFHHVPSPARALAEMKRVCAPNGRVAVLDLSPHSDKVAAFDAVHMLLDPSHVHAMTDTEVRAIASEQGLIEIATHSYAAELPLEFILNTCFPGEGTLDRVRRLYRTDAQSGANALGFSARLQAGEVMLSYPMTITVWQR